LGLREAKLPPGVDEPVFAEPWQTTAFAMTVALHERGLFSWTQWADTLSEEVKSGDPYYNCWLRALERLVTSKGVARTDEIDALSGAWQRAAHATPHGQPIVLENDPEGPVRRL
jgi:nitrile hydratase accessory protein